MTEDTNTRNTPSTPVKEETANVDSPCMSKTMLRQARIIYVCFWIVLLLFVALSELEVLPVGYIKVDAQVQYALQMLCILLTLGVTWASLSVFMVPRARRQNRKTVCGVWDWSFLRVALLVLVALLNGVIYYGLLNTASPMFCMLITYMGLLICWPRNPKGRFENMDGKQ